MAVGAAYRRDIAPRTSGSRASLEGSMASSFKTGFQRAAQNDETPAPTRPIRLFARPEPIEAIAEVPDGPPAQFTWRRVRHIVLTPKARSASRWNGGATRPATR